MTIQQVLDKIAQDAFTHKSVRILGKVTDYVFEKYQLTIEDPLRESSDSHSSLVVRVGQLK